jgi:hypothetical protein
MTKRTDSRHRDRHQRLSLNLPRWPDNPEDAETGDLLHSHAQRVADFHARGVGDLERVDA